VAGKKRKAPAGPPGEQERETPEQSTELSRQLDHMAAQAVNDAFGKYQYRRGRVQVLGELLEAEKARKSSPTHHRNVLEKALKKARRQYLVAKATFDELSDGRPDRRES
jgi:hypothetical protein